MRPPSPFLGLFLFTTNVHPIIHCFFYGKGAVPVIERGPFHSVLCLSLILSLFFLCSPLLPPCGSEGASISCTPVLLFPALDGLSHSLLLAPFQTVERRLRPSKYPHPNQQQRKKIQCMKNPCRCQPRGFEISCAQFVPKFLGLER